jgi:anti-sigma B factor antagonist
MPGERRHMSLEITSRDVEGIRILDLKGRLTLGQEDLAFRAELDRLVKAGNLRVALNFSDLHKLDTTGLGTLLFALAKLQKAGGKLAIFELKTTHIELLTEARLETVFEVFHDEEDAIDSFFPGRAVSRFDILEFVESENLQRVKSLPRQ